MNSLFVLVALVSWNTDSGDTQVNVLSVKPVSKSELCSKMGSSFFDRLRFDADAELQEELACDEDISAIIEGIKSSHPE